MGVFNEPKVACGVWLRKVSSWCTGSQMGAQLGPPSQTGLGEGRFLAVVAA